MTAAPWEEGPMVWVELLGGPYDGQRVQARAGTLIHPPQTEVHVACPISPSSLFEPGEPIPLEQTGVYRFSYDRTYRWVGYR